MIFYGFSLSRPIEICSLDDYNNFIKKIFEFEKEELTKIDIFTGLNKLIDIFKGTLFINENIIKNINDQKTIVNILSNNDKVKSNKFIKKLCFYFRIYIIILIIMKSN